MYTQYYGFKENPFSISPNPDYLYLSRQHNTALMLLEYGILNNAGFIVLTGEIGSGKTTLIRKLIQNNSENILIGLIANTHKNFGDLLQWICSAFDIPIKNKSYPELYENLIEFFVNRYAEGYHIMLIIDEAQNLDVETLEELRVLSNINTEDNFILQTVLVGQPDLRELLRSPYLRQFSQRIFVDYHILALSKQETNEYIKHRLSVAGCDIPIFTDEAINSVYQSSGGIPRLINIICDTALVYGFSDDLDHIDQHIVSKVIEDKNDSGIVKFNTKFSEASDIEQIELV